MHMFMRKQSLEISEACKAPEIETLACLEMLLCFPEWTSQLCDNEPKKKDTDLSGFSGRKMESNSIDARKQGLNPDAACRSGRYSTVQCSSLA